MDSKLVNLVLFFLVLFITERMIVMPAEAAKCMTRSTKFSGLCLSSTNCKSICETEKYEYGHCKRLRCKCVAECGGAPSGGAEGSGGASGGAGGSGHAGGSGGAAGGGDPSGGAAGGGDPSGGAAGSGGAGGSGGAAGSGGASGGAGGSGGAAGSGDREGGVQMPGPSA